MNAKLELKQPRELNRILFPDSPKTLRERVAVIVPSLPILGIALLMVFEAGLLKAWLAGRDLYELVPKFAACGVAFTVVLCPILLLSTQSLMWSQRKLTLGKKRVRIEPAKPPFVPWKHVLQWQLEPIGADGMVKKLSMEYHPTKKATVPRTWSMVVNGKQIEELRRSLHDVRLSGTCSAPIVELAQPAPIKRRRRIPQSAMWLLGISYALFIHGFPLFVVGVIGPNGAADEDVKVERLKPLIKRHFHSVGELRMFYVTVGTALLAGAAASYNSGMKMIRFKPDETRTPSIVVQ